MNITKIMKPSAQTKVNDQSFDFIIIGGGSAGATLAARLSEDPNHSVALIEAGGLGKDLAIRMPLGGITMIPGKPFKYNNWSFDTEPQKHLNNRICYQPRGKALGGSSAINAMLYVRGHKNDYDRWANEEGCAGWSWDDVLPYFIKSENHQDGAGDCHGGDGQLHVSHQLSPREISGAFINAAQNCQIPRRDDYNSGENEGAFLYQVTQYHEKDREGERCSSAHAFLHPVMSRKNLHVFTKSHTAKIHMDGKKAVGVRIFQNGKYLDLSAHKEIILSAGAFGSPQILQLSGIGRAQDIIPHGIEHVHKLEGVGQNLQDHLDFILLNRSHYKDGLGVGLKGAINLIKALFQWRKNVKGMASTTFSESGAFLKSEPNVSHADIQLHTVIGLLDDHARKLHMGYGYSCHICALRPHSRGHVALHSSDPFKPPLIDPNYLDDERDLKTLIKGIKRARDILNAEPLSSYKTGEIYLNGQESDAELEAHIRARADTIYHPIGTCKMGIGEDAVVDLDLKVHGLENLRVVDASIMPSLISGNTNAPTIMIAEKAADLIKTAHS